MKERYVKPAIYMESFALTQTIARNCGDTHTGTLGESTHYNENTCMWDLGGFTIFFIDNGCDDGPDGPDDEYEIEALCYNNPDGGRSIFSST